MAQFKGCLIHGMKRGGGGNSQWMLCGARGSGSMVGKVGATLGGGENRRRGSSPTLVQKEEEGARWAEWGKKAKHAGLLARQNLKRISFLNKN
jgi:hypothetical protein